VDSERDGIDSVTIFVRPRVIDSQARNVRDRHDESNPFHWDTLVVNCPGSKTYNPSLPWLYKVWRDAREAVWIHIYIDDVRITAPNKELAWKASSRVAKICAFLGLQDAARKRREPSQSPGARAGSVVSMSEGTVHRSVSVERWEKTQRRIRWIAPFLAVADEWCILEVGMPATVEGTAPPLGYLPHKQLESYRGFLVYVLRTYSAMVPYLKGIHLSLDSWRANRDEDGWRRMNVVEPRLDIE
jgi:hypothetical protein